MPKRPGRKGSVEEENASKDSIELQIRALQGKEMWQFTELDPQEPLVLLASPADSSVHLQKGNWWGKKRELVRIQGGSEKMPELGRKTPKKHSSNRWRNDHSPADGTRMLLTQPLTSSPCAHHILTLVGVSVGVTQENTVHMDPWSSCASWSLQQP